jgi:hypothetical protein
MALNQSRIRPNHQDDNPGPDRRSFSDYIPRPGIPAIGLFLISVTLLLLADSAIRTPSSIELGMVSALQGLESGVMSGALGFVDSVTGLLFALVASAIVLTMAAWTRSWGTAVIAFTLPVMAIAFALFERVWPGWSIPGMSLIERFIPSISIPGISGVQIAGAVLIYGLLYFVARRIELRPIRLALKGISLAVILLAGLSQLWTGALMPSEVLISLSIGGLLLLPLITLARRVDAACGDIPAIQAGPVPIDESKPHARALTSTVVFNESTVSKIYRPGFLPRAIYWLAFQAEFPYMRNEAALNAAVHRRNLIGQLTEFWYGSNHVAPALKVERVSGRFAITSEFIDGSEPEDRGSAKEFLAGLVERFEEAGLPTWQIDPRQPRATDNVIETEDGRYTVVDLESGLVAPLASIRSWKRAFQRGLVPMYDDVFFDVTRSYIEGNEDQMRSQHGDAWLSRLHQTLNETERYTEAWHEREPRIWSRLFGRRSRSADASRQHWAIDWFNDAIRNWRDEGRLTGHQAIKLQHKVRSPQFLAVMPHFGVHLGTGVLLRFPLGSIARAAYTAFNFARISVQYLTRKISREQWREGAGIHSPLVILFSAIPGFGAFAYLASKPIRSDHLMLCIGLDAVMMKLPWNIYERTRLRGIVTRTPAVLTRLSRSTGRNLRKVPRFAWSEEHRSVTSPEAHLETVQIGDGMHARTLL